MTVSTEIANTVWRSPAELPDLRRGGTIALDTETKDDGLIADRGSAWPWRGGYICGASVAYREGDVVRAMYFPLCHPDSDNFDREQFFKWLADLLASDVRVITQNGLYDFGWLHAEAGIRMPPAERLEEIGALATLVDENRHRYSLDALCAWRGIPGKDTTLLHEGAAAIGLPKRAKAAANIWRLPARYVGPYAEADASATLALFEDLDPILDREGTRDAYRLEIDLLPMVHEMRRRGIRIDTAAAEQARDLLLSKRDLVFAELSEKLGANVGMAEIGRNKWLAKTFDALGLDYPSTKMGRPSFTAGWMHNHAHWLPRLVVKADKYNKAAVDFLGTFILDHVVNGRVHAEIHPHRSDEGGTRSLRFSYSDPPLQQMAARDEEIAPLIRGVFLPEEGETWAKPDVSQQEFRFIVHYAATHKLRRAREAVERYRADPDADFHTIVAEMTGLDRQSAKAVNFAKAFGAGVRKFAMMIDKTESEAKAIYARYDNELPFVKQLSKLCERLANQQGYVELYDGARRHWDHWAPPVAWTKDAGPCIHDEAIRRTNDPSHPWFGKTCLRRADTHKAMNALIQGAAARHTKLWMRACWREGIVPLLQMHDALDCSVASPEQAERVAQLGREAVTLEVPMQVDLKFGRTWGDAKHAWEEVGTPAAKSQSALPRPPLLSPPPAKLNGHALVKPAASAIIKTENEFAHVPLPALIGEPLTNGKIVCPFHNDRRPSLHVYNDHFHCYVCDAHGDHVDWLTIVEGMDRAAALRLLATWDGPTCVPACINEDDGRTLEQALEIWQASQPISGTLATRYLGEIRKLDVDCLPADNAALRFHPKCPIGTQGSTFPCLIACYRDVVSDAFAGIHQILLTGAVMFTGGKVRRYTLGRWPAPRAIKLWTATDRLFLGEGVETVLAAATCLEYRGAPMLPAWASGPGGFIGKIPPVPGVEQLFLLVDHDINGKGEEYTNKCRQLWCRAGRKVERLLPPHVGQDFNDFVIAAACGQCDAAS